MKKIALCLCVTLSGTSVFYLICQLLRLFAKTISLLCDSLTMQKVADFIPLNIFSWSLGSCLFWSFDTILMIFACSMAMKIWEQLEK